MQEAVEGIRAGGQSVYVFAPSANASRGTLRDDGFKGANTVAMLLDNPRFRAAVRDSVIWIDEAGLLDVKTLNQVFELAERGNSRVVLSGDTRQHNSVRRGDAFRISD